MDAKNFMYLHVCICSVIFTVSMKASGETFCFLVPTALQDPKKFALCFYLVGQSVLELIIIVTQDNDYFKLKLLPVKKPSF